MTEEFNIALNISVPKDLASSLYALEMPNVKIESISDTTGEDASRFGVAEAVVALALIKGTLEVIKLGIEIRNLLKKKQETESANQVAILSSPVGSTAIKITPQQSDEEIESLIKNSYSASH